MASQAVVANRIIYVICKACGRQFVEKPEHYRIPQDKIDLINRLLCEKIPLAGIARSVKVSERWLQYYVNDYYEKVSRKIVVSTKKKAHLTKKVHLTLG